MSARPSPLASEPSPSVVEAVNEFLRAKARAGVSDRYLRQLRVSLGSFAAGRARSPLASVEASAVERWLERSGWSQRTRRGYLGDVRGFFAWAVRRGILARSPALGVEAPRVEPGPPPGIHTAGQVRQVLGLALDLGPEVARAFAVAYFAGLRSAELLRLGEADFRPGFVEVTARNAKTRRRRLVPVAPNLGAWLALPGGFPVPDAVRQFRRVRLAAERAGVPWSQNVCRHSFVSYHLAAGGSAAASALAAGHSEAMLFAHYRELVTPAEAAAFWSITPETEPGAPAVSSVGRPVGVMG